MNKRELTISEEKRRQELLRMKKQYNLTTVGLADTLPEGGGSPRTVESWVSGRKAAPPLAITVLKHLLDGEPIKSRKFHKTLDKLGGSSDNKNTF